MSIAYQLACFSSAVKDDVTSDGGGGGASESSAVKQALSPRRSTSSLDSDLSEFAGGRRMEGLLQALSNEKKSGGVLKKHLDNQKNQVHALYILYSTA